MFCLGWLTPTGQPSWPCPHDSPTHGIFSSLHFSSLLVVSASDPQPWKPKPHPPLFCPGKSYRHLYSTSGLTIKSKAPSFGVYPVPGSNQTLGARFLALQYIATDQTSTESLSGIRNSTRLAVYQTSGICCLSPPPLYWDYKCMLPFQAF